MHRKKIKMEENATRREEALAIEEISSPLSAQLLEYCYNSEPFHQETMPSSQLSWCQSSSSYRYDENSSPIIDPKLLYKDADILINCNNNGNTLYALVNDISASIDFSTSSPLYVVPPPLTGYQLDRLDDFSPPPQHEELPVNHNIVDRLPPLSTQLPSIAEDCVFSPSRATLLAAADENVTAFCADILMTGEPTQQQPQGLDYLGESGGFYNSDSRLRIFNPGDVQRLGREESQRLLLDGHGSAATAPVRPAELSAFDDPTFKLGKLSTEEKKEKIHRYLKKRNQRNFSKKIKYACRKTLADSRPRVKGRFARNDDRGKTQRHNSCSHEEDEDYEMGMKEADDSTNSSSDIFGHISAVNSFECSYLIQPRI